MRNSWRTFEDSFKAKCWTDSSELEADFDVASQFAFLAAN